MKTQSDKKMYTYSQACNKALKTGKRLSEIFQIVHKPGCEPMWIKKD